MLENRYFSVFRMAARGLEAQRIATAAASENLANASTTRTQDGTPYAVKRAVHTAADERLDRFANILSEMRTEMAVSDPRHFEGSSFSPDLPGVELGPTTEVEEDVRVRTEYDPSHPHADENGYVEYPDINVVEEMARVISANRVYEANLSAVQAAKEMVKRTLEI